MNQTIQSNAQLKAFNDPLVLQRVGDNPRHYKGEGNLCQQLAIRFGQRGYTRDSKINFLRDTFEDNSIQSTKDLTLAQALAVLEYLS